MFDSDANENARIININIDTAQIFAKCERRGTGQDVSSLLFHSDHRRLMKGPWWENADSTLAAPYKNTSHLDKQFASMENQFPQGYTDVLPLYQNLMWKIVCWNMARAKVSVHWILCLISNSM